MKTAFILLMFMVNHDGTIMDMTYPRVVVFETQELCQDWADKKNKAHADRSIEELKKTVTFFKKPENSVPKILPLSVYYGCERATFFPEEGKH